MGNTATSQKKAIQVKAAQAVGGKPVCDPNAPCQPCHRTDLQLLVVVPSVVVSEHKSDIDLASYAFAPSFDAEFVGMKRNGSLPVARVMKQGFVYVYYLERQRWDLWQIAPSGLTRKIMHQVDTSKYAELQPGFSGEQLPKNCSRGAANVPAHLISISGALSANEVWLAYSSDVWTSHTLQRYADNPEVDMPGSAFKTVKRKLRDVRGRQINATSAAQGKLQPFCLPLNVAALEHAVLDFASKIGTKLSAGCEAVQHPLDPARCGMATKFEGEVRALERALGVGLKNREHYVNTTSILMLPDALGVAEAHTHINARTSAERQYWEAGGPDATGANKNPNRPWERQSLLQVGFIMDWVAAAEKRKADERYGQGTKFLISKAEYGFYISKRGTDKRVVPDSTRYKYNNFLQKYEVDLPPEAKEKRSATVAAESTGKRLKRYKKHLNNDAIVLANDRWKNQADEWTELKKKRDQDYVDWLQTASFAAAVRYDFDDQRAVSDVKRSAAQVRVDAQEAATRLRVMSRCFGGAGCSGVSLDYFALQFQKDVSDKTHHIAQATIEEFGFASKVIDKVKTDAGARADIYDAYLASTNSYKAFAQAWASIGVPPVSDTSSIIVMVTTINAHLQSQALQIQMGGKKAVAKALERATTRSAMWVRSAGLLNHIVSNHRQYAFSVAWGTNAFAGATDDTIRNVSTLRSPAVNIDLRGNLTGKQAVEGQQKARMEVRNHVATNNVQGLRNVEATSMILCDQDDLIRAARMRGEKLVEVVSPGLFGLDPKITRVPESWAREMVGQQKHRNWANLHSKSGYLNVGTLYFQMAAFLMSLDDVQSKGGWDQMDAAGSLLGALAGVAGGVMELGSMLTTPGTLNKMGTPFAAELAAKVPVHLWLKLGSGLCLGAGAIFDSSVAYAKYQKANTQGDRDASAAYRVSAFAEGLGGLSLGAGAWIAFRADKLDRLKQSAARQAVVRVFGGAFSPLVLARCLTGLGLVLWLGGLGCSFYAMYLEDDDNEIFLRRSYFGMGHPELGRFKDFDHEVQSFGSLSMGTRTEMEWEDRIGHDALNIIVKVVQPTETMVVTARVDGYDGINAKFIRRLKAERLPPLKLSEDKQESASDVFVTKLSLDLPNDINAVKLSYFIHRTDLASNPVVAMGELWIED